MRTIKILSSLTAAVLALTLTACGGSGGDKETPSIGVSPSSLSFEEAGGSKTVSVTANVDWSAKSSDSWLSVSPTTGASSNTAQSLTVTATANDGLDRTATITISSPEGASATVSVTQTAYMPTEINEVTVKEASNLSSPYKYQKYRFTGTVKNLQSDGTFNLVDDTGTIPVAGLNASDAGYGKQGGVLDNVKDRDQVTIVGYLEVVDGKMTVVYAYLEEVVTYSEPDPSSVKTQSFPYEVDYTTTDGGVVINNPVFPIAFDAIWTRSSTTGWQASGYTGGASYTTESWLYTEKVDLTGAKAPIFEFSHSVREFADIETAKKETSVWISVDGGEFEQLGLPYSYPDEQGGTVVPSEIVNLSEYIGKTVQFAFRYTSSQSGVAGIWCITKVQVIEDSEGVIGDDQGGTEDYDKPGWDWDN